MSSCKLKESPEITPLVRDQTERQSRPVGIHALSHPSALSLGLPCEEPTVTLVTLLHQVSSASPEGQGPQDGLL